MSLGQFVRSLKGNAFERYTDLESKVTDSWEQLEKGILKCFYSTRHNISMMKLTNTKQLKGELVIDCINQCRTLSFDCKDRLIELRGTKDFPISEVRKDKKEMKGAEKIVKSTVKKSMIRPKQAGKVDNPNYCKYHRVISHPVEKCFVLKELILRLAREKKIELDLEEVTQTNYATVTIMLEGLPSRLIFEQRERLVQFETFEPIVVQFYHEVTPEDSQEKERLIEEDDEEWIAMARQKKRKSTST
ncbi:Retrotransposon gag protein [Cucumis melo var. makuwa]|uniref:Retrotransposon gag protein n=1 Tax=Cucumis melo var. makuwa TaxID=1194695 RepID=A0A5A7V0I0_CUCMM|nr:Retrotransposon gag protein [Cucumis melo var. makuwa]TYK08806.1 Retrotransposon gag protein [Cucumis melo var. makuwa]